MTHSRFPAALVICLAFALLGMSQVKSCTGTVISKQQFFDKCTAASVAQMQTWRGTSPYFNTNVYIGGSSRGCSQPNLTAAWVSSTSAQGWGFVPTWVGPQAPCTSYGSRFSYDVATANSQGRTEADGAIAAATSLGLCCPSIIYYDLEAYNTADSSCRNATKSFINGWTTRMAERGMLSGVYGSGCGSAPDDFVSISTPPSDVWLAHWIYSSYNAGATVWNVACVPDSHWATDQRLRQYAGGHNETYGGTTFNIDSSAADGRIQTVHPSALEAGPAAAPGESSPPSVEGLGLFGGGAGWTVAGGRLLWTTDRGRHWTSGRTVPPGRAASAFFRDAAEGWVATVSPPTPDGAAVVSVAHSLDGGARWQAAPVRTFVLDDGNPLGDRFELTFADRDHGWLMTAIATSSSFSRGLLFRTRDGGWTWDEVRIPIAGDLRFADADTGFVAGGAGGNDLYVTRDGGESWDRLDVVPASEDSVGRLFYDAPVFSTPLRGVLPVTRVDDGRSRVDFFRTEDAGRTWEPIHSVAVSGEAGTRVPVASLGGIDTWIVADTSAGTVSLVENGVPSRPVREIATWPAGIVALHFSSPTLGWIETATTGCVGLKQCASSSAFFLTEDGGGTWTEIAPSALAAE